MCADNDFHSPLSPRSKLKSFQFAPELAKEMPGEDGSYRNGGLWSFHGIQSIPDNDYPPSLSSLTTAPLPPETSPTRRSARWRSAWRCSRSRIPFACRGAPRGTPSGTSSWRRRESPTSIEAKGWVTWIIIIAVSLVFVLTGISYFFVSPAFVSNSQSCHMRFL